VTADPFDLQRFLTAQDSGATYDRALAELRRGRKTSHWIWFVFPQIAGLGSSAMSRRFAIASLDEARAYLAHPVLRSRLLECAETVAAAAIPAEQLMGGIDAQKLHSSMTLVHRAEPEQPVFALVLAQQFGGRPDPATDQRI
jgi:uncharacterized protein (DUF1810 family)